MAAAQHAGRFNYANNNPLAPPSLQFQQQQQQQQQQQYHHPHSGLPPQSRPPQYPSSSSPLPTVLDRPLPLQARQQRDVSLSAFSWLFSEIIQYVQQRADSVTDIEKKSAPPAEEKAEHRTAQLSTDCNCLPQAHLTAASTATVCESCRLSDLGYSIGIRYLDLSLLRSAPSLHPSTLQRPRSILTLLQHIHSNLWRQLFSHPADGLEKSTDAEDEYYIYDNAPVTNRFLSVPKGLVGLNCAAFVAGVVAGVCDAAGFQCEVGAHFNAGGGGSAAGRERTVYIIKFEKEVMRREATIAGQ